MANGMYIAMGSAHAQSQRLETLSHDLANAQTPGFKRQVAVYRQVESDVSKMGDPNQAMGLNHPIRFLPEDRLQVVLDQRYTDFTQGPLKQTGNPLDVALRGEGFFTIEGPEGPLYTRNGTFTLGRDGALVNSEGQAVLSDTGRPIRVPGDQGMLVVTDDGRVMMGEDEVARLGVVRFDNMQNLQRVGASNYRQPDPNVQPQETNATVAQGFLEGANVNPVYTMVTLIKTNRIFEMSTRAIQAYKAMDDGAIREVGRD